MLDFQESVINILKSLQPEYTSKADCPIRLSLNKAESCKKAIDYQHHMIKTVMLLADKIAVVNYNRGLQEGLANGIKIISKVKKYENNQPA